MLHNDNCKHILVTHLSELMKSVTFEKVATVETLFLNQPDFSLKKLNSFKSMAKVNSSVDDTCSIIVSFPQVVQALKEHKCSKSNLFPCRFIFQALTGVRSISTFSLACNSIFVNKTCLNCKSGNVPCQILTPDCFNKLTLKTTKTSSYSFFIIPQCNLCYLNLLVFEQKHLSISRQQDAYNKYLKRMYNCTSHGVRKFLPNFFTASLPASNTGNWSSLKTMKKYYLKEHAKYFSLYQALLRNLDT